MGRGGDEKALRRAQAQLDKAIARRDVESAVDVLLALDKATREPLLESVASLFRRVLPDLQRQSAWARLHTLAARAEQEPRLLSHGTNDPGPARWPLFLACMRARDFTRAQRYWQALTQRVTERAPALAQVIAAWVAGQGQVDARALATLDLSALPAPAAVDPRLGNESATRSPGLPPPDPPTTAERISDAVHLLFAAQPLHVAGDIVLAWHGKAPPEITAGIRGLACSLAMR